MLAASPTPGRAAWYRPIVWGMLTSALILPSSSDSSAQFASRSASVTLIATLESLSVAASPRTGSSPSPYTFRGTEYVPVTIVTKWAVPSHRTTVRLVNGDETLLMQTAGESNLAAKRVDDFDVVLSRDLENESNRKVTSGEVLIQVQAL
jgi:hypothetical protein